MSIPYIVCPQCSVYKALGMRWRPLPPEIAEKINKGEEEVKLEYCPRCSSNTGYGNSGFTEGDD